MEYTADGWDSLYSIAQKYGVSVEELAEYNGISEDEPLQYGQVLKIPSTTKDYLNIGDEEFKEPVTRQVIKTAKEQQTPTYKRPSIIPIAIRHAHNGVAYAPLPTKVKDYVDEFNSAIQMGSFQFFHDLFRTGNPMPIFDTLVQFEGRPMSETWGGGPAQRTYLMRDRDAQRRVFEKAGYFQVEPYEGSLPYGTATREAKEFNAKRGETLPMYQKYPNAVEREYLIPVGNISNEWYGPRDYGFYNSGAISSAIYVDPRTHLLYQNAWDLNNYGGNVGVAGEYDGIPGALANLLDYAGLPVVMTTGYQPITFGTDHHYTAEEIDQHDFPLLYGRVNQYLHRNEDKTEGESDKTENIQESAPNYFSDDYDDYDDEWY